MEENTPNKLAALRRVVETAGYDLDWEPYKTLLKAVLKKLPVLNVCNVALDYLNLYLPRFKAKNPQELWVERYITQAREVLEGKEKPEALPAFSNWSTKLADPMSRTFRSAVANFWIMAKAISDSDRFAEQATETIMAIMVILRTEYAVNHWTPDTYPRKEEIGYRDYLTRLWTNLATKLEKYDS